MPVDGVEGSPTAVGGTSVRGAGFLGGVERIHQLPLVVFVWSILNGLCRLGRTNPPIAVGGLWDFH